MLIMTMAARLSCVLRQAQHENYLVWHQPLDFILSLSKDEAAAAGDTAQSSRAPPETLSASPVT